MTLHTQPGDPAYYDEAVYTQSDMDHVQGVARRLKREKMDAERAFACAVAVVGEISIPARLIVGDCPGFVRTDDPATGALVFRTGR